MPKMHFGDCFLGFPAPSSPFVCACGCGVQFLNGMFLGSKDKRTVLFLSQLLLPFFSCTPWRAPSTSNLSRASRIKQGIPFEKSLASEKKLAYRLYHLR